MPKTARAPLTKARIAAAERKAQETGKLVRLWDAGLPGLGVRVQPTGAVAWFLYYSRDDGGGSKAWRTYTLRTAEAETLEQIRARAELVKLDLLRGADPLDNRKAEREAERMDVAFPRWLDELDAKAKQENGGVKASTVKEYRRQWDPDAVRKRQARPGKAVPSIRKALGAKKVKDVESHDVRAFCRAVSEQSGPTMANRMRARLHTFFNWCEKEGLRARNANPVSADVDRNPEQGKERFLQREQITALLAALDEAEQHGLAVAPQLKEKPRGSAVARPSRADEMRRRRAAKLGVPVDSLPVRKYTPKAPRPTRGPKPRPDAAPKPANPAAVAALRFLLWSGWREQEVLSLRWDAINAERSAAVLQGTKTGTSTRPLAPFLVDFLLSLPRRDPVYVFPGKNPGQPLKEIRHVWYAVRHRAGLAGVRLHDLRHTNASVMISAGASLAVVGAALGHKDAKSTQRYATVYNEAVSAAQQRAIEDMRAWATGATTPVTPLPTKRNAS